MSRWLTWLTPTVNVHRLQLTRRAVQWLVVVLLVAIPATARYSNYLMARQLDRQLEKWEGTAQGNALSAMDGFYLSLPGGEKTRVDRQVRDRTQVLEYARQLKGGPWSAEIGGVSLTDPMAAAESVAARKRMATALLLSVIIPVVATLLLGRVFCSWICPMNLLLELTDKLRRVLRFLELKPSDIRFFRGTKYVLLAVGLAMSLLISLPLLGYVYPPAIIGREAHAMVSGFFDRAELGKTGLWIGGLTWLSLIIVGIAVFEVFISRRWWCRYVCPGGALYTLLGRFRPVRVKLDAGACTGCAACVPVCQMGLNPMKNDMGSECDNCGLCISHCPGALEYGLAVSDTGGGEGYVASTGKGETT